MVIHFFVIIGIGRDDKLIEVIQKLFWKATIQKHFLFHTNQRKVQFFLNLFKALPPKLGGDQMGMNNSFFFFFLLLSLHEFMVSTDLYNVHKK